MRHCAKFCADRSSRCLDYGRLSFFKMAAVCHLVFLKVRNCQNFNTIQYNTVGDKISTDREHRAIPLR